MSSVSPAVALLLQGAGGGNPVLGFAPIIVLFIAAWFLLIRPMQVQRREQEAMRSALKSGDPIVTIGGIHGTITKVKDDRVVLRVADGIHFELSKAAVASLQKSAEGD